MSEPGLIQADTEVADAAKRLVREVGKAILGKEDTIRKAALALLCNGHLLIEDVPGVGKTVLAKALAKAIGGEFRRIQFTPDLLPSDITGVAMFNQQRSEFEFRPGPIFGNIVLADEINRATPKTQAALLEAMEERQVTVDGTTHFLPDPFFVIATQNNVEMTGTYPLPEAQLDRFFARLSMGYPDRETEADILDTQRVAHPLDDVRQVVQAADFHRLQGEIRTVDVSELIRRYIVDIVRATRDSNQVVLGASPRGSLLLMQAAQAEAAYAGRDYVTPDDVKVMAPAVLGHRVIPRADLRSRGIEPEAVIEEIIAGVAAPVPSG
ncbi:MAG: MoxR family ATPase [Armatimonadota bacterium]|nr:MoxR family ATPase [Armatimonadota bacterium]